MSTTNTQPAPLDMETARRLLVQAMQTQGPEFRYSPDGGTCIYVSWPDAREIYEAVNATGVLPVAGVPRVALDPTEPRERTGCLIGTVLDLHGSTFHRQPSNIYGRDVLTLWGSFHDELFEELAVAEYLQQAQLAQDRGSTWGKAVAKAEEWYRERFTTPPQTAASDLD